MLYLFYNKNVGGGAMNVIDIISDKELRDIPIMTILRVINVIQQHELVKGDEDHVSE